MCLECLLFCPGSVRHIQHTMLQIFICVLDTSSTPCSILHTGTDGHILQEVQEALAKPKDDRIKTLLESNRMQREAPSIPASEEP